MEPQKKKPSLFAQQMQLKRSVPNSGPVLSDSIKEKSQIEVETLESSIYSSSPSEFPEIPQLTLSPAPPTSLSASQPQEILSIHHENLKKISEMSPQDIQSSLEEIESLIDPSTLEILRNRGKQRLKSMNTETITVVKDISEVEIERLQHESQHTCMHSKVISHSFDTLRYDENGCVVQKYENNQWIGDCQGFSLRDLAYMARSSFPAQRVMAIHTLCRVMSESLYEKLNFLFEECQVDRLIIFSLDDKNATVRVEILNFIKTIFLHNLPGNCLVQDKYWMVYPLCESKRNPLLNKEIRNSNSIWEEEVNKTEEFEGDGEGDLISSLLVKGLLSYLQSFPIEEILEILLSIALHSISSCYFIVRSPIFPILISNTPKTYEILSILSKSSLPASYKIKQSLPERTLADILTDNSCRSLLYSLFLHGQALEIRNLCHEMCMDGSPDMFMLASVAIASAGPGQFQSIAEVSVFKYLQEWEVYCSNLELIEAICRFLAVFYRVSDVLPVSNKELFEILKRGLGRIEISGGLVVRERGTSKYITDLQGYISVDEWENGLLPAVKMIGSILQVIECLVRRDASISLSSISDKLYSFQSFCLQILESLRFDSENSYPRLLCYRLKPLTRLLVSCINLSQTPQTSSIFKILPLLSSYDEFLYLELLKKALPQVPDYYLGYICSEKHLSLATKDYNKLTNMPTYFLGLNENPYLPLQFDWAFIPLTSESSIKLQDCLGAIRIITQNYLPYCLTSIITDINMFFVRKDIDFRDFSGDLEVIIERVASAPQFAMQVNKIKNSVLNLVKDFVACSYLEITYVKWVMAFLSDEIDSDLFKDILEEIDLMIGRVKEAIGGNYIGGIARYTRLQSFSRN